MGYIQGDGRNQGTLFPVILDDFVPADHVCRVIDAFVERLVISELGFERAHPLRPDDLDTIHVICSNFICTVI